MEPTTIADTMAATNETEVPADPETRAVVMTGVWLSALRCIIQYVAAPTLGIAGFWLPWLSQLVQILACLVTISAAIRLQAQRDRRRHRYTMIAICVLASTLVALLTPIEPGP